MCKCGEIIRDQSDHLAYKGYLSADTEYFDLFDKISADVAGFIQARLASTELKWIAAYFADGYPTTQDKDVIHEIITRHLIPKSMDVFQCPNCGRLHVAYGNDSSRLASFASDDSPHKDIFHK